MFIKVSEDPLYERGCTFDDITAFLKASEYRLKLIELNDKAGEMLFTSSQCLSQLTFRVMAATRLLANRRAREACPFIHQDLSMLRARSTARRMVSLVFILTLRTRPGGRSISKRCRLFSRIDTVRERAPLNYRTVKPRKLLAIVHRQSVPFGGIDGYPPRVFVERRAARYVRLRLPERACLHLDETKCTETLGG